MSPDFKWLGFWISNPIQNMASFRQLKIWMNPDFRYPLNIQTQLESKIQMHPDFECWKRGRMWKVPVFECHSKTDFCSPNHSKNWTFCPQRGVGRHLSPWILIFVQYTLNIVKNFNFCLNISSNLEDCPHCKYFIL